LRGNRWRKLLWRESCGSWTCMFLWQLVECLACCRHKEELLNGRLKKSSNFKFICFILEASEDGSKAHEKFKQLTNFDKRKSKALVLESCPIHHRAHVRLATTPNTNGGGRYSTRKANLLGQLLQLWLFWTAIHLDCQLDSLVDSFNDSKGILSITGFTLEWPEFYPSKTQLALKLTQSKFHAQTSQHSIKPFKDFNSKLSTPSSTKPSEKKHPKGHIKCHPLWRFPLRFFALIMPFSPAFIPPQPSSHK
jgi:hypothetical protein